jgi:hypothetical protein
MNGISEVELTHSRIRYNGATPGELRKALESLAYLVLVSPHWGTTEITGESKWR